MRQGIFRALLVLALLVPLSQLSFADGTFPVGGILSDSGDTEVGSIGSPYFGFEGKSEATWGLFDNFWAFGSTEQATFGVDIHGGNWSFDGITGLQSYGTFDVVTDPFTVGEGSVPSTWTGELYFEDFFGTALFEIQMAGVGTASFSGTPEPEFDGFLVVNGTADVTGTGEVVYVDPSALPEPSTLTLMSIAGIASILATRFRRTKATQS